VWPGRIIWVQGSWAGAVNAATAGALWDACA